MNKQDLPWIAAALTIGVFTAPLWGHSLLTRSSQPEKVEEQTCGDSATALSVASFAVSGKLKNPKSADFASYLDSKVSNPKPCVWQVASYVDAENSFGAELRTPFYVEVEFNKKNDYRILSIRM